MSNVDRDRELPIGKSFSCNAMILSFPHCDLLLQSFLSYKEGDIQKLYIQYNVHTKCHYLHNKKYWYLPVLHFHKICNMQVKLDG